MPDRRHNRGAHPRDEACFTGAALPALRTAVAELSWLLSRGYPDKASLALVGDRHRLRTRQRAALQRCAVPDKARARRRRMRVRPAPSTDPASAGHASAGHASAGHASAGHASAGPLMIDGYNVLLTVEAALAGAVVLRGRDGALRDMAAMSSHYRRVRQTRPALTLIGEWLASRGCNEARWYLDRPISNSARLKGWIEDVASAHGWRWRAELVADPDRVLIAADRGRWIATADGGILDRLGPGLRWLALAAEVVDERVPDAWLVDLSPTS